MWCVISVFQKLKELTYMHSEGILSGELKHGPLAMIDKDMPCIMIVTKDNTYTVCTYVLLCVWKTFSRAHTHTHTHTHRNAKMHCRK